MEALLLSKTRKPISDLFLLDWSEPDGTASITDKSGRVNLTRNNANVSILNDVSLGRCTYSNGNGGWVQSNAQYPLNMGLSQWTLSIEAFATNMATSQILMAQARASSGGGGWYLSLVSGRFDFYWKDVTGVWHVISTAAIIPEWKKFTIRVVRNGTTLSIYIDDVLATTTSSNVTFNGTPFAYSIGQWADVGGNMWYGRIGKIRFTDS